MQYAKTIVKAIEQGLSSAQINRIEEGLSFNNLNWNYNYNYIFSYVKQNIDDEDLGLEVREFRRCSYSMPCIYDRERKTLFTIISKSKFEVLRSRRVIEKPHYTDAFCLLSKEEGSYKQLNMFGEEVETAELNTLQDLLTQLTRYLDKSFDIDKYALITCDIDHKRCQLNDINVNYLSKHYDVLKTDTSWNKYININYSSLFEDKYNNGEEFEVTIALKQPEIKLKTNNEELIIKP